mmetsp:Transcript_1874/g.5456  ORF Transcript_1874/g.5456 Transcript_1874/m.5456 type:complete len:288 (-) Transcript_1874:1116-1979(-)
MRLCAYEERRVNLRLEPPFGAIELVVHRLIKEENRRQPTSLAYELIKLLSTTQLLKKWLILSPLSGEELISAETSALTPPIEFRIIPCAICPRLNKEISIILQSRCIKHEKCLLYSIPGRLTNFFANHSVVLSCRVRRAGEVECIIKRREPFFPHGTGMTLQLCQRIRNGGFLRPFDRIFLFCFCARVVELHELKEITNLNLTVGELLARIICFGNFSLCQITGTPKYIAGNLYERGLKLLSSSLRNARELRSARARIYQIVVEIDNNSLLADIIFERVNIFSAHST